MFSKVILSIFRENFGKIFLKKEVVVCCNEFFNTSHLPSNTGERTRCQVNLKLQTH